MACIELILYCAWSPRPALFTHHFSCKHIISACSIPAEFALNVERTAVFIFSTTVVPTYLISKCRKLNECENAPTFPLHLEMEETGQPLISLPRNAV
jgi:hypothetical protein